jgi:hypothetical protein
MTAVLLEAEGKGCHLLIHKVGLCNSLRACAPLGLHRASEHHGSAETMPLLQRHILVCPVQVKRYLTSQRQPAVNTAMGSSAAVGAAAKGAPNQSTPSEGAASGSVGYRLKRGALRLRRMFSAAPDLHIQQRSTATTSAPDEAGDLETSDGAAPHEETRTVTASHLKSADSTTQLRANTVRPDSRSGGHEGSQVNTAVVIGRGSAYDSHGWGLGPSAAGPDTNQHSQPHVSLVPDMGSKRADLQHEAAHTSLTTSSDTTRLERASWSMEGHSSAPITGSTTSLVTTAGASSAAISCPQIQLERQSSSMAHLHRGVPSISTPDLLGIIACA